jgi:hypothetical protein
MDIGGYKGCGRVWKQVGSAICLIFLPGCSSLGAVYFCNGSIRRLWPVRWRAEVGRRLE